MAITWIRGILLFSEAFCHFGPDQAHVLISGPPCWDGLSARLELFIPEQTTEEGLQK